MPSAEKRDVQNTILFRLTHQIISTQAHKWC